MTTSTPLISMVVAISENNGLGKDNQLLWHLPNDLNFFKKTTSGHTIIMGRKTYESIGRALPNRRNIVISRHPNLSIPGVEIAPSIDHALAMCADETEIFIIGGGEIYKQLLPQTNRIYLTKVHTTLEADTFFPTLDPNEWTLRSEENHPADDRHTYAYSFICLQRK